MGVKIIFVAVCLLVGSSAFATNPFEGLFHLNMFMIKAKDYVGLNLKPEGGLGEPDPAKCLNDSQQLRSPQFRQCSSVFNEDPTHTTPREAQTFCQHHCAMFLSRLLHRFIEDCPIPEDQRPTPADFKMLEQSCDHPAGQNTTCLQVWSQIDPQEGTVNADYLSCLEHYHGDGACPDECKRAEHWVLDTMGCCYRSLKDFGANQTHMEPEGILTDRYWNGCGIKEPDYCPSPRH